MTNNLPTPTIEEILLEHRDAVNRGASINGLNEALSQLNRIIALKEQLAFEAGVEFINVKAIERDARIDELNNALEVKRGDSEYVSVLYLDRRLTELQTQLKAEDI